MTDLSGKMAALGPSFAVMHDRTGKEGTPDTMEMYTRHFVRLGLAMNTVNETVFDIMASYDGRYWPSPEHIAKAAQHRQRAELDIVPGTALADRVLDDWCEVEGQRRWDSRVARANAWREAYRDEFKTLWGVLGPSIDRLIEGVAQRYGVEVKLKQLPEYRQSFREGAGVGMCLAEETRMHMRELRRLDIVQREHARSNMIVDAQEIGY